jgi:uncharacterized membrane protein YsdA (DUF1294 family)
MATLFKDLVYDYFLLVNLAGFILMGVDKLSAMRGESRIPEKWFFTISMAGGPFGVFLGMIVFHHKTRKTYFGFIVTLMLAISFFILIFNNRIIIRQWHLSKGCGANLLRKS